MVLSNKQITKALARLHQCAGWSVPLLVQTPKDKSSRVEAQMLVIMTASSEPVWSGSALFCLDFLQVANVLSQAVVVTSAEI